MTKRHWPNRTLGILTIVWVSFGAASQAADVLDQAGCGSCHRVEAPAAADRASENFSQRKAPDLHYAGNKYRDDWLREWLRNPQPIRPAGMHPELHVVSVKNADQLDPATLESHPAVAEKDTKPIVAALMKRRWGEELLPAAVSVPTVPAKLAELNFIKFKGCGSCHRTTPAFGGLSGPELYTAWRRLRPEFMWSYIANPQAWDPVTPMPGYGLSDQEVGKLMAYLRTLATEDKQ